MRVSIRLIVALLICCSCHAQNHPISHRQISNDYTPAFSSEQLYAQLNKAYKKKSFNDFFKLAKNRTFWVFDTTQHIEDISWNKKP